MPLGTFTSCLRRRDIAGVPWVPPSAARSRRESGRPIVERSTAAWPTRDGQVGLGRSFHTRGGERRQFGGVTFLCRNVREFTRRVVSRRIWVIAAEQAAQALAAPTAKTPLPCLTRRTRSVCMSPEQPASEAGLPATQARRSVPCVGSARTHPQTVALHQEGKPIA